ncbi:MAG: hypothetical protein R6X25_07025 [Candidatus Krumholzibacteriia bacterium]
MKIRREMSGRERRLAGALIAFGLLAVILSAFSMGLRHLDPEPGPVTGGGRGAVMFVGILVTIAGVMISRRRQLKTGTR